MLNLKKDKTIKKILLCRPDRMGDVILTLPAVVSIREKYPDAFIAFLCKKNVVPVLENYEAIDEIVKIDEDLSAFDIKKNIEKYQFDISVHFFIDFKIVFATFLAGVKERIGPFSKIASFFLNKRIRQSRSKCLKNEADYNLELAGVLGGSTRPRNAGLKVTDNEEEAAKEFFTRHRINNKLKVCIHPGGAKRAKRWSYENFIELACNFRRNKLSVFFTFGPQDMELFKKFNNTEFPCWHGSDLRKLMGVISGSDVFISNSTGPLHIASGLGKSTCSFYSSQKACVQRRWGPYPPSEKHLVFESPLEDLSDIKVKNVYNKIKKRFKL